MADILRGLWNTLTQQNSLTSKSKPVMKLGLSVRVVVGMGPPEKREPNEVVNDVREGLVSPEEARDIYAVALVQEAGNWRINEGGTADLRRERGIS